MHNENIIISEDMYLIALCPFLKKGIRIIDSFKSKDLIYGNSRSEIPLFEIYLRAYDLLFSTSDPY